MELICVDVRPEDVPGHLLVFSQKRCAGKSYEDRALKPALHLFVHVAALRSVALVDEHVKPPGDRGRFPFEVRHVELVYESTQETRCRRPELLDELRP